MPHAPILPTLIAAAFACAACNGSQLIGADLTLPAIISDHAMLQRSAHTRVWGWADAGTAVTVKYGNASGKAIADKDGAWTVALDLTSAPATPGDLVIDGGSHVVVKDVLVGDLWLCGGQSNMAFSLDGALDGPAEIAASQNQSLRCFHVPEESQDSPQDHGKGTWLVANPAEVGKFSAVGYFFAKAVQHAMNRPIGLVAAPYPATGIDSWMPAKDLDAESKGLREKYTGLPARFAEHQKKLKTWFADNHRDDLSASPQEAVAVAKDGDDPTWITVGLPGTVAGDGLPAAGSVWLRHAVEIAPDQVGKDLTLALDAREFGAVYWNGHRIDQILADEPIRLSVSWEKPWTIRIPGAQVFAGTNVLTFRIFNPAGKPALPFDTHQFPLLAGAWIAKTDTAQDAPDAAAAAKYPGVPPVKDFYDNFVPSSCYDAMIHPLLAMNLTGVIWYQGEGDTYHAPVYRQRFPTLIKSWRGVFGAELPFFFCQLPNRDNKQDTPKDSQWAELREAQTEALSLPHTGMAVLIDTADGDLHPRNKRDPGERLAKIALASVYGKKEISSGPMFASIAVEGAKIRVKFKNPDGLLVAKPLPDTWVKHFGSPDPNSADRAPLTLPSTGSAVQGFAICGADHEWQWAQATIDHVAGTPDSIVVWSLTVPKPVAVRYAWADNPTCNLFNGTGLPAAPFRTDAPEPAKR